MTPVSINEALSWFSLGEKVFFRKFSTGTYESAQVLRINSRTITIIQDSTGQRLRLEPFYIYKKKPICA